MNAELIQRHQAAIAAHLGEPGRLIALSKSGHAREHPLQVIVWNANVCIAGGKIWHGDFDLTGDEQTLIGLAAAVGEPVYLLSELDARFQHEDAPLLDQAVYSVTPTGHTRFDPRSLERCRDGALRLRPPLPVARFVWPARPRLWRPWHIHQRTTRFDDRLGRRGGTLITIGTRGDNPAAGSCASAGDRHSPLAGRGALRVGGLQLEVAVADDLSKLPFGFEHAGGGPAQGHHTRGPAVHVAFGATDDLDHRLARIRALERALERAGDAEPVTPSRLRVSVSSTPSRSEPAAPG